jgi:prepilin-type processing-associated H-X9-DG protein
LAEQKQTKVIVLMKAKCSSKKSEAAFNLAELGVVIACAGILAMVVLPALAADKLQSASTGCLYNLRHLQTGGAMYAAENNNYLVPNAPLGTPPNEGWCDSRNGESWGNSIENTNPATYESALLWPYLGNNLSVFRCPGDSVPSANGFRLRSYSMNGQMGAVYDGHIGYNPGYLTYSRVSDIIRPTPANAFVFADESPDTINDGYLQIGANSPGFPDAPADYLEGGCGFSFADGHAEIHRWQTTALLIPVQPHFTGNNTSVGSQNADWIWLIQHATSHQ